jgi:ABC-2 type transport system ATP-binding protein
MRRRLDLAGALVAGAPVIFLDEPTTGLDPRSRLALWEVIADLVREGTTVLLTTQYLEEADRLAHDIVVIDAGRVIAHGTADQLKAQVGGERIEVVVHDPAALPVAVATLSRDCAGECTVDEHRRRVTVPAQGGAASLVEVVRDLDGAGVAIDDIALRRPTLDDVFLSLTGHAAEDKQEQEEPQLAGAGGGRGGRTRS